MKESDQRRPCPRPRAGAAGGNPSLRGRAARPVLVLVAWTGTALAGCSSQVASPAAEALDPEDFVETYVALRLAAMESSSGVVSDRDRDRILAQRGTSAEALRAFVERHGEDLVLMEDVWDNVQKGIREAQDGWTAR